MKPELCRCGASPRVRIWENSYFCGCIKPKCFIPPAISNESKEDAIEKWNEQIKSLNEHFAEEGETDGT